MVSFTTDYLNAIVDFGIKINERSKSSFAADHLNAILDYGAKFNEKGKS